MTWKMVPFPPPPGGEVRVWRITPEHNASTWNLGEGSRRFGGRWNSPGTKRVVYFSLDPATATLEMAVQFKAGIEIFNTIPHTLTSARLLDPGKIEVVTPDKVTNPLWLTPGIKSPHLQKMGDGFLQEHIFVAVPSAVSRGSWNLIADAERLEGEYEDVAQERFCLDPRVFSQ